jgi:hypothetical protein
VATASCVAINAGGFVGPEALRLPPCMSHDVKLRIAKKAYREDI